MLRPRPRSGSCAAVVVACMLACLASARANDPAVEAPREIWRFVKDDSERSVDVTDMPTFVREGLVARLEAEGYARRDAKTPTGAGRHLAEDVRTLARHGGRFPEAPPHGVVRSGETPVWEKLASVVEIHLRELAHAGTDGPRAEAARRGLAELARRLLRIAGSRGLVLGARVAASEPTSGWRIEAAPSGSMAAALGLGPGDRILAVDGAPATPEALAVWEDPTPSSRQRILRVLRTDGRIETWTVQRHDRPLAAGSTPAGRRSKDS